MIDDLVLFLHFLFCFSHTFLNNILISRKELVFFNWGNREILPEGNHVPFKQLCVLANTVHLVMCCPVPQSALHTS